MQPNYPSLTGSNFTRPLFNELNKYQVLRKLPLNARLVQLTINGGWKEPPLIEVSPYTNCLCLASFTISTKYAVRP